MSENNNNESSPSFNRREVLKSTGVGAGLGLIGLQNANDFQSVNRTHIVEAGLKYRIDTDENINNFTVDAPPLYYLTGNGTAVIAPELTSSKVRSELENSNNLIRFGSFRNQLSSVENGARHKIQPDISNKVPISLTSHDYVAEYTKAVGKIEPPEVNFHLAKDNVIIETSGVKVEIPSSENRELEVKTDIIELETREVKDSLVSTEKIPKSMRSKQVVYGSTQVEATAILSVSNIGDVEIKKSHQ